MATKNLYDMVNEASSEIAKRTDLVPEVGIILGTGLGGLTDRIEITCEIAYPEIPHFDSSTVETHQGRL